MSTVTDTHTGNTTYRYDNVGNLQGYLYPNGVQTTYSYNTLNRLTNLAITNNKAQSLASYAYTLGPAGNRIAVSELTGRVVNYTYDALYRLTNESISGDPNQNNGAVGYQYDPVGNRLLRTSTLSAVPAASYSYDANDRLASDSYDSNGSTTASGGNTYAYDFESHLTSSNGGAVTVVYDGDGNRVAKTASGATTQYLVDDRNPTGYAQVLEELSGGAVQRVYTYGLNRISQSQASGTSFYGYDGQGSVRFLTDSTGAVTDRYDYDAFGNMISQAGSTPNVYLYAGEQNDSNLGFYYLRARYLNTGTGRFVNADPFAGDPQSPLSLHKYLYASANPTNRIDPSGLEDLIELQTALRINSIFTAMPTLSNVWVAAYFSKLFGGLPDAVGFGVFATAGFNGSFVGGGIIGGYEVIFAPRLQQGATYLFGGFEPSSSVSLSPQSVLEDHRLFHEEVGVFTTWYWNLHDLNTDVFSIIGTSGGGGFFGSEGGGGTTALLFGISNDVDFGIFGILGSSRLTAQAALSESVMLTEAATAEAEFSLAGLVRFSPGINIGGVAAAIVNAGAVGTWVGYTYGKP